MGQPLIDTTILNNATAGDKRLEAELFEAFEVSVRDCVAMLYASCKESRREYWYDTVYAIKAVADNLGVIRLSTLAMAALKENLSEEEKIYLVEQIEQEFHNVVEYVRQNKYNNLYG